MPGNHRRPRGRHQWPAVALAPPRLGAGDQTAPLLHSMAGRWLVA